MLDEVETGPSFLGAGIRLGDTASLVGRGVDWFREIRRPEELEVVSGSLLLRDRVVPPVLLDLVTEVFLF